MLSRFVKRIFYRPRLPPMTASEAEVRLKGVRAQLARNKGDSKRVASELQKKPNLTAERKRELKARLETLRDERVEIQAEVKAVRRVTKKSKKDAAKA
jgi:molecular chaperone GrpE (heat shock protein)